MTIILLGYLLLDILSNLKTNLKTKIMKGNASLKNDDKSLEIRILI